MLEIYQKKIKLHKKNIELRALCLVQKSNFHEFEDIIILCKEMGFIELNFQVQLTGWGKDEWEKKNIENDINFNENDKKEELLAITKKYNNNFFKVSIVQENLLSEDNKCSYPWHNPYISAEGKVVPCCMIADPKVVNFGDINDKNFNDIWNSGEYMNFRKTITDHKLNDFCKNCYKEKR